MAATIISHRLKLRSPKYSDLNDMVDMDKQEEVQKYLFASPQSSISQSEQNSLRRRLKESIKIGDSNGGAVWAIEDKKSGDFIGMISLELSPATRKIALGFRIKPQAWRQGFATEAVQAVIEYAFSKLMISEMSAIVHPSNIASQRVVEKCGFQRDGLLFVGARTAIDSLAIESQYPNLNPQASISYHIYTLLRASVVSS